MIALSTLGFWFSQDSADPGRNLSETPVVEDVASWAARSLLCVFLITFAALCVSQNLGDSQNMISCQNIQGEKKCDTDYTQDMEDMERAIALSLETPAKEAPVRYYQNISVVRRFKLNNVNYIMSIPRIGKIWNALSLCPWSRLPSQHSMLTLILGFVDTTHSNICSSLLGSEDKEELDRILLSLDTQPYPPHDEETWEVGNH